MNLSPELIGAVAAVLVPALSYVGSAAALKVHLHYLRRDVDAAALSARRAHNRLDHVAAPPATF
jgi:hypothetical protein